MLSLDEVVNLITLTGALGTTSMGLVETAKRLRPEFAASGYDRLMEVMGHDAKRALTAAYGDHGIEAILKAAFRQDNEALSLALRNGIKIGYTMLTDVADQEAVAKAFGQDEAELVRALSVDVTTPPPAAPALPPTATPEEVTATEGARRIAVEARDAQLRDARNTLGKFEMAVDMRVSAAVASSADVYAGSMQISAAVVSMLLALIAGMATLPSTDLSVAWPHMVRSIMIGVAAVPVAPIANDLVGALKTAADAIRPRTKP